MNFIFSKDRAWVLDKACGVDSFIYSFSLMQASWQTCFRRENSMFRHHHQDTFDLLGRRFQELTRKLRPAGWTVEVKTLDSLSANNWTKDCNYFLKSRESRFRYRTTFQDFPAFLFLSWFEFSEACVIYQRRVSPTCSTRSCVCYLM